MRNNNRRARTRNSVDSKNVKKNEPTKNNFSEKSKGKVVQSSNNSLGQQCIGCQGYGHVRSECPTFLKSKGKAIAVTLSDDEESGHEFESDEEGNFFAFTAIAVVGEPEIVEENASDEELFEKVDLQEAYNKLCKIEAKDAMNVDLGLKKIDTLEHEKKNLLVKLFDANELIIAIKFENMSLIEKVKSLEFELHVAREQIDRTSTSKLDNMLKFQKFAFDKTGLGYVESGLSSMVIPTKFVPPVSMLKPEVRVHKEEVVATKKIRVDLSDTKPKKSTHPVGKKQHKPQWFCHFCGGAGHTRPNCFKLQVGKQQASN